MRMQVDAFGKIEESQGVSVGEVLLDKDFSAEVFDNFANNRKRFNGRSRDQRDYREHRGGDRRQHHYQYQNYNNNNYNNFQDNKSYQTFSVNDTVSEATFLSSQVGK